MNLFRKVIKFLDNISEKVDKDHQLLCQSLFGEVFVFVAIYLIPLELRIIRYMLFSIYVPLMSGLNTYIWWKINYKWHHMLEDSFTETLVKFLVNFIAKVYIVLGWIMTMILLTINNSELQQSFALLAAFWLYGTILNVLLNAGFGLDMSVWYLLITIF